MIISTASDTGAYILGVLWGAMALGAKSGSYWIRHRDPWFVYTVKEVLNMPFTVQEIKSRTGLQYRLKITNLDLQIQELLDSHGWKPRNAEERNYPLKNVNDRGFIRAWVELHSTLDIRQVKYRNDNYYPQKRLRIYGNWALLAEINFILCTGAALKPRAIQKTSNEITKAIYFQGSSIEPVINWLYNGAEIFNPAVRSKFN